LHVALLTLLALSTPQVEPGAPPIDRPSLITPLDADAAQDDGSRGSEIDAVLRDVLSRREFQRSATSVWLESLRKQVGDWMMSVMRRLAGSGLGSRTAAVAIAWAASLLALAALALWLVEMLMRRSRADSLGLGPIAPPRAAAREWAQRAMAAAKAGDFRGAVRFAYHAALCRLEEQGAWRVDDSRTPREYVRLLRADDPRLSVVSDLTRQFEQVWYGRRIPTDDDARLLTAHLERLGCLRAPDRAI
jgi:Domain of unknown function (DUF4129)